MESFQAAAAAHPAEPTFTPLDADRDESTAGCGLCDALEGRKRSASSAEASEKTLTFVHPLGPRMCAAGRVDAP